MPKLYLVRHAEPYVTGVLLGQSDPPLSDRGLRQAGNLQLACEMIYTSPLQRALQTAVASGRAEVVRIPEFAEISLGQWDGLTWAEIEQKDSELASRKLNDWTGVTPPGGEPWADFERRVTAGLARVLAGSCDAAIVAHLAANSVIANRIAGSDVSSFQQEYCEILEYEY
jgi:broad specificity phosphatase PhoE